MLLLILNIYTLLTLKKYNVIIKINYVLFIEHAFLYYQKN